ncbi:MAG TPA: SH3 domain-containing protein [Thermoanaerobaculia bacterium]
MKELARTMIPRFALALLMSLGFAIACSVALGEEGAEPPGSDVFTSPREALLREKPSPNGRVVGRLTQGTRLTLVEARPTYLHVNGGWIARDVVVVFGPDAGATRELVTVGRTLAKTDAQRRLAAALLLRASDRLRGAKTPDPEVELLLGETAETLAASGGGGHFPPELGPQFVEKTGASGARVFYGGSAFQRALELLGKDTSPECARQRERATAGLLRAQYPEHPANLSLTTLTQESAAWLTLAETAEDPAVLRSAAERAGAASLAVGRYLLALGRAGEIDRLQERARAAGARVQTLAVGTEGRRLVSRGVILRAMMGNGTATFPQESRIAGPVRERTVRIEGKLGALQLIVETRVGNARDVAVRKAAVPILPVPGSLRIAPDGKAVAWVEVVGPSLLVPVITSLERDEPAREIAFLSDGRPLRDRSLAHCMASLAGYSSDGQRLGMEIEAWNDTPGPAPRYSVVSVATGELLFETSKDMKGFQRLLQ